jgi:WD40 repeat protein
MGSILFDLEVNTWVYALVTLPNGNFVSGSSETSINILNSKTGSLLNTLLGHSDSVNLLATLPKG